MNHALKIGILSKLVTMHGQDILVLELLDKFKS